MTRRPPGYGTPSGNTFWEHERDRAPEPADRAEDLDGLERRHGDFSSVSSGLRERVL